MEARHVTIDGSSVSLRAPAVTARSQPSSVGVFAMRGAWQEFTTSYREFGRDVAAGMGVDLTESYSYQDGTLWLGSASIPDPIHSEHTDLMHLGVWEGQQFSVHTHLYNGTARDLIPIFDEFRIVEGPRGIQLLPKGPKRTRLAKEPMFLQELSNVGLLQVKPLTRPLASNLPKWQGTRVTNGELFVGRRPGSLHLLLVGKRSHTMIAREGEECGKTDLSHIVGLSVDWRPGALLAGAM